MSVDRHYSDRVWQHFLRPCNAGAWRDAPDIVSGEAETPASGALMRLQLRMRGNRIEDARFQVHGCVSAIAAGSWVTQRVRGRCVREAWALDAAQIDTALALAPEKRFCALLAEDALRSALAQCAGSALHSSMLNG